MCVTGESADALRVQDASAAASLAAVTQLDAVLHGLSLPPEHVVTVFEAILRRGVSPRGAVPLDSLLEVPLESVHAMRGANLIELRQGNVVGWEDYAELVPLKGVPYVCAPSPLARESMALVLAKLQRGSLSAGPSGHAAGNVGASGADVAAQPPPSSPRSAPSPAPTAC